MRCVLRIHETYEIFLSIKAFCTKITESILKTLMFNISLINRTNRTGLELSFFLCNVFIFHFGCFPKIFFAQLLHVPILNHLYSKGLSLFVNVYRFVSCFFVLPSMTFRSSSIRSIHKLHNQWAKLKPLFKGFLNTLYNWNG